jgi:hypothetical protein
MRRVSQRLSLATPRGHRDPDPPGLPPTHGPDPPSLPPSRPPSLPPSLSPFLASIQVRFQCGASGLCSPKTTKAATATSQLCRGRVI